MSLIVRFMCCDKKMSDIRISKRRDFIWLTVSVMVEAGAWRRRASDVMEAKKQRKHACAPDLPFSHLCSTLASTWRIMPAPRIHHGSLPLVLSEILSDTAWVWSSTLQITTKPWSGEPQAVYISARDTQLPLSLLGHLLGHLTCSKTVFHSVEIQW